MTTPSNAMASVIALVQQILTLTQQAAKEVLLLEVEGENLSKDHAHDIYNAIGKRSCKYASEAMALAAEMELEAAKATAKRAPLITLEEHHE